MFFVAKVGRFMQREYAFFELAGNARYRREPKVCPGCEASFGRLPWLEPYRIQLKNPNNVGDIVYGAGGCDFMVSRRFLEAYRSLGLTGIQEVYEPITVVRMGTTKKSNLLPRPELVGVSFVIANTLVDESAMGLVCRPWPERTERPCHLCHFEKEYVRYERIAIRSETWQGHDFFFPIPMLSTLVLSQRAVAAIEEFRFANFNPVPAEQVGWVSPTFQEA